MTIVDTREKDFLTAGEMARFLEAARKGKHGVRDYLLGLMAYRHGLRVSELIRIRLGDIDLDAGRIFVRRMKGSMSTSHPMQGDEVRAIRAWLRERDRQLSRRRSRNGATRGTDGEHSGEHSLSSFRSASGLNLSAVSVPDNQSQTKGDGNEPAEGGEAREGTTDQPSNVAMQDSRGGAQKLSAARNGDVIQPGAHTTSLCMVQPANERPPISESDGQKRELRRPPSVGLISSGSELLFVNEKHRGFARQAINYLFGEIGKRAGLGHVHPHMFRHSCGYALANKGCDTRLIQDYLGHKDIHNTERYTRTSASRFERLWQ